MIKNKKVILFLLIGLILIISLFVYQNKAVIFQCGNPIPYVSKMFSLDDDTAFIDVFDDKSVYITKRYNSDNLFQFVENEYGVTFTEQMGSGYIFESDTQKIVLSSQIYWRYYMVWSLTIK